MEGKVIGLGRFCFVVVLATALIPGSGRSDVTITFVSDESWQAAEMNLDLTQGAPAGNSQCACFVPGWGCWQEALNGISSSIPGSCEIWSPAVTAASIADLQGAYFSKQFTLPGIPTSGSIAVAVDDFAEIRVNGAIVGSFGSISDLGAAAGAQSSLHTFDLTAFLASGTNTITIRAQNGPYWFSGQGCNPCNFGGNPAGLVFTGQLTYDPAVPTRTWSVGQLKALYR
jgi:hypothetical protein